MSVIGIDASRAAVARQTGTETYSYQLLLAFAGLDDNRNGHDIRLYTPGAFDEQLADAIARNPHVSSRIIRASRFWTQGRLAVEMLVHRPDVLFVPSHRIPWIHPRRVVVTCHDVAFVHVPDAYSPADVRRLWRATRQMVAWGTRIIAVSECTRRDLIAAFGAREDQVEVIYHGIDSDFLVPQSEVGRIAQVREKYGIGDSYVVCTGRIERKKNVLRLVQAFERLVASENVSHDLVLVGADGFGADEVHAYIAAHHLQDRIHVTGYVSKPDYVALLDGADALMYPSLYEGFGFPLLEAFARGIPVCASNAGSIPEIAGDAALLVDPLSIDDIARGMMSVTSEGGLRSDLVRRGHVRVARFSWEASARATRDLLFQLVT
jgi:glycosyltransferase involved in cell wall biosynthesis